MASNAEMGIRELKQLRGLDPAGEALLKAAVQRLGLSARAYHRVPKVARTTADLAASARGDTVSPPFAPDLVVDVAMVLGEQPAETQGPSDIDAGAR